MRRNTPNTAVREELVRYPMVIYSIASSVRYYHRVINKDSSNLEKKSLIENINLHNQEQKNWYTKLDRIMQKLDLCKFNEI